MLYVCVRGVMNVVFSVCIVTRGAVGARVWEVLSVSSCRCCMFVSCVHSVAVLNAAFCKTCSLLMLVEDARSLFCLGKTLCRYGCMYFLAALVLVMVKSSA